VAEAEWVVAAADLVAEAERATRLGIKTVEADG
jgi:hypothetical protein